MELPKKKTKKGIKDLEFDEILMMDMFTKCHVCAVRESCTVYDEMEPRRQCPIEPIIYRESYDSLIKRKNVEPEKYATQIHELAMLRVKLWRREKFESLMGTTEADLQGASEAAIKISRIITQKEKNLGTDRGSIIGLKKIGARKGDMVGVFKGVEGIVKGKIQLINPKQILAEASRLKRAAIVSIEHKKITFADLEFDKLGIDIKQINKEEEDKVKPPPYQRPKRK